MRAGRLCAGLLLLATVGACSGSADRPATTAPPPTTTAASAQPTADPGAELARLAAVAARASYAATYRLRAGDGAAAPSVVRIALARPAARVALSGGGHTALFVVRPGSRVACDRARGHTTCYRLEGPARQAPRYLDPGVQHVFLDYPRTLARRTAGYRVEAAGAVTPAGVPAGDCFHVIGRDAPARAAVATGRYCFSPDGVLVAAVFRSGRLTLTDLDPAPDPATLTPPATPRPLPTPLPSG